MAHIGAPYGNTNAKGRHRKKGSVSAGAKLYLRSAKFNAQLGRLRAEGDRRFGSSKYGNASLNELLRRAREGNYR